MLLLEMMLIQELEHIECHPLGQSKLIEFHVVECCRPVPRHKSIDDLVLLLLLLLLLLLPLLDDLMEALEWQRLLAMQIGDVDSKLVDMGLSQLE